MESLILRDDGGRQVSSPAVRDMVAVAFRRRKLILLAFTAIVAGACLTAFLEPSRYESEMKILVKRDRVDPVVTAEASIPQWSSEVREAELNSEVELFRSSDLMDKVVRVCGLDRTPDSPLSLLLRRLMPAGGRTRNPEAPIAAAVRRLSRDLRVDVVKKTNLIAIRYEAEDPKLAARVLSTLAAAYLEKHVEMHKLSGTVLFFHAEVERNRKELNEAEARLMAFTRGTDVVSASAEKQEILQKLSDFKAAEAQTAAAIAEAQGRMSILREQVTSIPSRMTTQVRNTDDGLLLAQLKSNLLTYEQKRTELLGKFAPGYRAVQEVDALIAKTKDALADAEKSKLREETTDRDPTYEWARQDLAKAEADLASEQSRAGVQASTVRDYEEKARSLEREEVLQGDLLRAVKTAETNYMLYLQKEEEARMSEALDRNRILNVNLAQQPTIPVLPSNQRVRTVLFGLLLALATSAGLGFLAERLDSTFSSPHDLELFLSAPVLATLPKLTSKS